VSKNTPKNSYESLPVQSKLIFLSGVFDGEGSFGIWSKGVNRRKEFACKVEMSDYDSLKKFSDMFGGNLTFCKKRQKHHKQTWAWRQNGHRAFLIIDKMIEFMCIRRQEKYYVDKRDKIGGTGRYAHLQEASRNKDADGRCSNDARKENGSRRGSLPR